MRTIERELHKTGDDLNAFQKLLEMIACLLLDPIPGRVSGYLPDI